MPRNQVDSAVTLSVLDRLTDLDPKSPSIEGPLSRAESMRILKAGLRRDLEWLLNTRRTAEAPGDGMAEVGRSVYFYGLPDFSAYSIASPKDQSKLVRALQTAIKIFEPRLAKVRVVPLEANTLGTRSIRLRLEGLLMMDPAPELISFDTTLQLTTGDFQVRGESDAG